MPDRIPPPDDHPDFLTTSAERMVAAQAITAASGTDPAVTAVAADMLDLMSSATLVAVGVSDPADRVAVLAIMWGNR
jgi:hypothetical protein